MVSKTIKEANAPFANGLKIMIAKKDIKQSKLARDSGLGVQRLSDIITGRRIVRAKDIYVLCKRMRCSIDEVFKEGM